MRKINYTFSWNGFFYGKCVIRKKEHYFKSQNVRFDDTYGKTLEINEAEYFETAQKYADVFGGV